jgi:hypothetical protein
VASTVLSLIEISAVNFEACQMQMDGRNGTISFSFNLLNVCKKRTQQFYTCTHLS